MKVGDYVRTKYGIKQIYEIDNNKTVWKYKFKLKKQDGDGCIDLGCFSDNDVIKSSPNIIDLIEVGDYVNGVLVESIYQREKDKLYIHSFDTEIMMCFTNNNIETIITKEQFERMEYNVGE